LELDDGNFGLFHARRATGGNDNVLVEDNTVHQLGVLDRPADFLDDADISQIDIGGSGGDETGDSGHRNRSEGR
jgi:hypothetical protein